MLNPLSSLPLVHTLVPGMGAAGQEEAAEAPCSGEGSIAPGKEMEVDVCFADE